MHGGFTGWYLTKSLHNGVAVSCKKSGDDDCPLPSWRCCVDVDAEPAEVLTRVLSERHVWDDDLIQWRVVQTLDPHTDVFHFVVNGMAPSPATEFCELRFVRTEVAFMLYGQFGWFIPIALEIWHGRIRRSFCWYKL